MLSYIVLFIAIIPFLSKNYYLKLENKIYSLIITSALFSYSLLGLISLILIFSNRSRFPTIVFSITILLNSFFFNKAFLKVYKTIIDFLIIEINYLKKNYLISKQRILFFIIFSLILLISFSSIGPINHPDALDYHVGYPFQYWLRGGFFIDNGMHQALMGIGDYANLSFIQEKTIWFIRYIQISNLPFLSLFLLNNLKNKLYIIAFLSSSTFIQWSTMGKPLFIGDSSCAIAYILWSENKDNLSRKLLIICIISCISIKISSLIICFPIAIHVLSDILFNRKNEGIHKKIKNILFDKSIFLSIIVLFSILLSRLIVIDNFAFPLLTNIFNKNDLLINSFARYLSGYQRDNLFPLNIFIPLNYSDVASALGPGVFIILILLIIKNFKSLNFKDNILFHIGSLQIVLLLLFCQGRSDYYAAPLIILIYFSGNYLLYKQKFIKIFLKSATYFQIILTTGFLLFTINQNLLSILNYEKSMSLISYGYDLSKLLNHKSSGNTYQNIIRDTRFFYPKNFIAREQITRCLNEGNSQSQCLEKNNVSQIISRPNYLEDKKDYFCKTKSIISGARNPLNRKKRLVEICEKN